MRDLQWQLAQVGELKQQTAEIKRRMGPAEVSREASPDFLAGNSRF